MNNAAAARDDYQVSCKKLGIKVLMFVCLFEFVLYVTEVYYRTVTLPEKNPLL